MEALEKKTKDLREIKVEEGQFIQLLNYEGAEENLKKLAESYKGLKITPENKKEGKEAERKLRHTRYALQRIYKSNNEFLNKIKKEEKQVYDSLISIIKPVEENLNKQIKEIEEEEKRKKEEAKRLEEERIKNIQKKLNEYSFKFEEIILKGISNKDKSKIAEFEETLNKLESEFETFEEMEFEAKRLHAINSSKLKDLKTNIEALLEAEKEKERREKELEAIKQIRKKQLKEIGFNENLEFMSIKVKEKDLELRELEWHKRYNELKQLVLREKEKLSNALKTEWSSILLVYEGLGGDISGLKEMEPTADKISALKEDLKKLQEQKRIDLENKIKSEIKPYIGKILKFIESQEKEITQAEISEKAKKILSEYIKRFEELAKRTFENIM